MRSAPHLPPLLAQGLRSLRRRPLLSAVVVAVLAVGIGSVVLVHQVLDRTLLHPLGLGGQERLVFVWESLPSLGTPRSSVAAESYHEWRRQARSFEALAAVRRGTMHLRSGDRLTPLVSAQVGEDFFRVLPLRLIAGRTFDGAADDDGVVLSEAVWRRLFAGDRDVLGRQIVVDGIPRPLVGVLAANQVFPRGVEVWVQSRFRPADEVPGRRDLLVVGRLADGVAVAAAQQELDRIAARAAGRTSASEPRAAALVTPLRRELAGEAGPPLVMLFAAVSLVLLIVSINVANVLLVRAAARRREIAIRSALGAGRGHLARLLGVEVAVLVGTGGALGLGFAELGRRLLHRVSFGDALAIERLDFDPRLAAVALLVSVLVGLLVVLLPLRPFLRFARGELRDDELRLRDASGGTLRLQKALVAGQLLLALPLLTLGLALLDSLVRLQRADFGFRPDGVVTLDVALPEDAGTAVFRRTEALGAALQRLADHPGVSAAGAVSDLPMSGSSTSGGFEIVGRATVPGSPPPAADLRIGWPGYFEAMGIRVVAGRSFQASDGATSTGVALVNEGLARRYWPGESPLGQRIRVGNPEEVALYGRSVTREVVGVVADVVHHGLGQERRPEVYLPYGQSPTAFVTVTVRSPRPADEMAADARVALLAEGRLQVLRTRPMAQVVSSTLGRPELQTALLLGLGTVALVLVALSVYAVMSSFIQQRRQDLALHMVVGADASQVTRLVVRQCAAIGLVGVAGGALASWAALGLVRHLVFVHEPSWSLPAAGSFLMLGAIATGAILLPLRRFLRHEPAVLLRPE